VLSAAGIDFPFRWCPANRFMMGSPLSDQDRYGDENQMGVTGLPVNVLSTQ
jgi:hypothetical protein